MLGEAHVLAVDSKAFLETADAARALAHRLPFKPKDASPASHSHSPSQPLPPSPAASPDSDEVAPSQIAAPHVQGPVVTAL